MPADNRTRQNTNNIILKKTPSTFRDGFFYISSKKEFSPPRCGVVRLKAIQRIARRSRGVKRSFK